MAQCNHARLSFNNPSKRATIPLKYLSIPRGTAALEVIELLYVGVFLPGKTNIEEKTGLCRSHPGGCLRHVQSHRGKLRGYFGDDPAEALAK